MKYIIVWLIGGIITAVLTATLSVVIIETIYPTSKNIFSINTNMGSFNWYGFIVIAVLYCILFIIFGLIQKMIKK